MAFIDSNYIKNKCQRFSPKEVVSDMLSIAGYISSNNLLGKKVLEHSFGTGNILLEIVNTYIQSCMNFGVDLETISDHLSNDIQGFEIDPELFNTTINKLDCLTDNYSLPRVKWSIKNADFLKYTCDIKYDYIIGNPPYITYSDIDDENKVFLRNNFESCHKGKFDYYYAFLEKSVHSLNDSGILVQLVPNSLYKNVYAKKTRELLQDYILKIYTYPSQQLFEDTLTSTSIFMFNHNVDNKYVSCVNKTTNKQYDIERETLIHSDKWVLVSDESLDKQLRFGDYFNASNAVATLLNKAFIIDSDSVKNIENSVLRPAVSPKSLHFKKKKYVIFPYRLMDNKVLRFNEEDFVSLYPNAAMHLSRYKEELDYRKADKNAKWFEYGRSQALSSINQTKLLMSTVLTKDIHLYKLDKITIPYAGIFIVQTGDLDLSVAYKILNSNDFLEYLKRIGININGTSLRISCRDINDYMFSEDILDGNP